MKTIPIGSRRELFIDPYLIVAAIVNQEGVKT
jgi:hypothetical protein